MASELREVWRRVPGYEDDYEVSNMGNVRSLPRVVQFVRLNEPASFTKPGRAISKQALRGYRRVALCKDGTIKNFYVHGLVLLAFVGPKPEGLEVRHLDGNPANNHLENLRYGTKAENAKDRAVHGTQVYGEQSSNAKLTREKVEDILLSSLSSKALAKKYEVAASTIENVRSGKRWPHVFRALHAARQGEG